MAQSLEVNIKTTSDVPQAMDKAKAATSGFSQQLQKIGDKFSTAFKDIALGFIAPMVIFQNVLGLVSSLLEQAKQDAKEGFDLMVKGETKFATSEQKKKASFVDYMLAQQEEERKVKEGAQNIYEGFLNTPQGKQIYDKYAAQFSPEEGPNMFTLSNMARSKKVRADIEEYFKTSPEYQQWVRPTKESTVVKEAALGAGVIGVGASPQIALAMEANDKLSSIDSKLGELVNAGIDKDPTKPLGRKYPLYSPGLQR
jgi:hypothetical protein